MISFEHVSFGYDGSRETLAGLNAAIRPGECVLLCGASGCGKTTVTKLVNGLIPAFTPGCRLEGRVEVDGLDPAKTPMHQLARKVGSVFQNPKSQFFNLDTDSELAFGLENAGCPPEEIRARVAETVKALGLESLCGQSIFSLSGGQKQLLAFGSVYAMGPDIFVLDEPTANLDQEAIARLHDEIAGLKRQGRTVVIAEHRLYFLTDLIDQAWYIKQGVLSRRFTREEFQRLTDEERERLGLRTLSSAPCTLPPAEPAGSGEGLSVEGLTCAFQKREAVFRELSFSVRPGEVVAVTGPNGVGKTTLSRCLCGLLREQAGTVRLHGRPLGRKERQRAAFCVMQDVNHQLFTESVLDEILLSMRTEDKQKAREILQEMDLLSFEDCHPMGLSGGQKQRVAVASAIASERPMILFDEPTSGLDLFHMRQVANVVNQVANAGRTALVVTHDPEFILRCCNYVLHLENGQIQESYSIEDSDGRKRLLKFFLSDMKKEVSTE